jgi:hypothetical protein
VCKSSDDNISLVVFLENSYSFFEILFG